jgi:hypothetical protein
LNGLRDAVGATLKEKVAAAHWMLGREAAAVKLKCNEVLPL